MVKFGSTWNGSCKQGSFIIFVYHFTSPAFAGRVPGRVRTIDFPNLCANTAISPNPLDAARLQSLARELGQPILLNATADEEV
jgi:hypothetical protein